MPKDEWKNANARARFGPQRYTGDKRNNDTKTHRRAKKARHTYVSIGTCMVKLASRAAVQVILPAGNPLWIPRSVVMNGNMNFRRQQVLELRVDLWFAERERVPFVPRGKSDPTPEVTP